jgi:hypothetical protein
MTQAALKNAVEKLSDFEAASPYDTSEIEVCMEALATALFGIFRKKGDDVQPDSLQEAIEMLPISSTAKTQLLEICSTIEELIERSDYDTDEEDEDKLSELKTDFSGILETELSKLQSK